MPPGTLLPIGLALGVVFGVVFDNLAIGMGTGVALGGAMELGAARRKGTSDKAERPTADAVDDGDRL